MRSDCNEAGGVTCPSDRAPNTCLAGHERHAIDGPKCATAGAELSRGSRVISTGMPQLVAPGLNIRS